MTINGRTYGLGKVCALIALLLVLLLIATGAMALFPVGFVLIVLTAGALLL